MYIEPTMPAGTNAGRQQSLPQGSQDMERMEMQNRQTMEIQNRQSANTRNQQNAEMRGTACNVKEGALPHNVCASLAFPYVPMQNRNAKRYDNRQALERGTLFPGLDLPFHRELKTRFPAANTALSELMALDFAIDELGLYLTTHSDDKEALDLYWDYIRLGREGRERYEEMYGPLLQTDITEGSFKWLDDPWPWDLGGND